MSEVIWDGSSCVACSKDKPNWNVLLFRCEPPCLPSQHWEHDACVSGISYCHGHGDFVLDGECVRGCPETWNRFGVCEACTDVDASKPFWNPMTKRCVAACPNGLKPDAITPSTCKSCSYPQFFDKEKQECVNACQETWDANRVCERCSEATSGAKPYWDSYDSTCVESCPDHLIPNSGTICLTCK